MDDTAAAIRSLMCPRSVAVIGASDNPARIGGRPIRYLLDAGFGGDIFPVNPNYQNIQGLHAYPSASALPRAPDVAIIALPAEAAVTALRESAEAGTRGAIIFSADFAESGEEGRLRQEELAAIAQKHGVAMLGPNCLGAFNASHRFYGSFSAMFESGFGPSGNVGIVSQSGGYGSHLCKVALRRGVRVGQWMTTGNEAGLDVGACIEWMASQRDIGIIIAYTEGVRERASLVSGLQAAAAADKPVLFLKAGKSEVGSDAVRTHTAAMSGSDAVFDGMLVQFGATRMASTEAAADAAYLMQRMSGRPQGRNVALVTISGAAGVQMADAATEHGLEVPPLPQADQQALKSLNPFAATRNPIDVTAQAFNRLELVRDNLELVLRSGIYDALVAFFTVTAGSPAIAPALSAILSQLPERYPDVPMVLCIIANDETVSAYEDAGFIVFEDHHRAIAALAISMHDRRVEPTAIATRKPPRLLAHALGSHDGTEHSAKAILREIGIPTPEGRLASTPSEAVSAAASIGFPVVVKVHSPTILHKTEVGGVRLNLTSETQVEEAAKNLLDLGSGFVLVEAMAPEGVELILGFENDPELGPVVMLGFGGVMAEVYKDVVFRLAPLGAEESRKALASLKASALFRGFRGRPQADVDAAAAAVATVSASFAAHADLIASLEINPLRVLANGEGVVACDAVLQTRKKTERASALPAQS